ncbi:hypothetical protein [Actinoallomurus sp. NPDC050550]|uniref:hypothetical protein n=1 Tax=Actinoallomurus sp. NPDC050550 TaxID=3154937 RepID=UPI0033D3E857
MVDDNRGENEGDGLRRLRRWRERLQAALLGAQILYAAVQIANQIHGHLLHG